MRIRWNSWRPFLLAGRSTPATFTVSEWLKSTTFLLSSLCMWTSWSWSTWSISTSPTQKPWNSKKTKRFETLEIFDLSIATCFIKGCCFIKKIKECSYISRYRRFSTLLRSRLAKHTRFNTRHLPSSRFITWTPSNRMTSSVLISAATTTLTSSVVCDLKICAAWSLMDCLLPKFDATFYRKPFLMYVRFTLLFQEHVHWIFQSECFQTAKPSDNLIKADVASARATLTTRENAPEVFVEPFKTSCSKFETFKCFLNMSN